ncbi:unnamed protein product [Discosporangium mesarthrocarpum]
MPDRTSFNRLRNNAIRPNANECVDIKEGAEHNLVQGSDCTSQHDDKSGCFGSRGNRNVFRWAKSRVWKGFRELLRVL